MPKDKTETNEKIMKVAMNEFLSKGFMQASMKSIADTVGITSAGLYRHCVDKQDLFAQLVRPGLQLIEDWNENHKEYGYQMMDDENHDTMWEFSNEYSDAAMILDVVYQMPDVFYLLLYCSVGTPYEHYLNQMIEKSTDDMLDFLNVCQEKGIMTYSISRKELHMLISAYIDALLQPVKQRYTHDEAEQYLITVIKFFNPGWRMITGL